MSRDNWSIGGCVALLRGCAPDRGRAAECGGRLIGTVVDAQGKVVVDEAVSVLTGDRATVASAITDGDGRFMISGLPAGLRV